MECAGNLQNRIVKSKRTGRYHFYYRIRDTWGNGSIMSIDASSFDGLTVRVADRIDGLGTVRTHFVCRSPYDPVGNPHGPLNTVHFGVDAFLAMYPIDCHKHQESHFLLIKTEATTAHGGGVTQITTSNGNKVWVPTVQP